MNNSSVQMPAGRGTTVTLMLAGIILLLPGVWALAFIIGFIAEGNWLSFDEPMAAIMVTVWALSFLISLGGALMIRAARRRARRPGLRCLRMSPAA